jgi:hypothetical protein
MREYYGDRYVDYLRALGVSVSWTILEKPEHIGQKHGDWNFRVVPDTQVDSGGPDNKPLGFTGGYFKGKVIADVKPTFTPEHGLISVMLVVRADPVFIAPAQNPLLSKRGLKDFWSPEFESEKLKFYSTGIFQEGAPSYTVNRPNFEEHRKGINENRYTAGGQFTDDRVLAMLIGRSAGNNQFDPSDFNSNFDLDQMAFDEHYQATADWRLTRTSPLMRHGQMKPIY